MRALVLDAAGMRLAEVESPEPGHGQVKVHIRAAGLCHSDLTLAARPATQLGIALPLTLGHEWAGDVVACGADVQSISVGDAVVGYGPAGCGDCRACREDRENYCRCPDVGRRPPGIGTAGGLAAYLTVDQRHVLPAPGVDPVQAAVLSDAGLTTFHALRRAVRPGDTVLVIGLGGLGHAAPDIARLVGAARVLVHDRDSVKVAAACARGGEAITGDNRIPLADRVRAMATEGVDVVLDLVASTHTLVLARDVLAPDGVLSIVGVGTDRLEVGMHAVPLGARVDVPFWGARGELSQLLELARRGQLRLDVEQITMDEVLDAYQRMEQGQIAGRAAVVWTEGEQ